MILTSLLALAPSLASQAPNATAPDANAEKRHWSILFYGGSDNDSEESFCPDMEDARLGLAPGLGVELLALVDRSPLYSDSTRGFGEDFEDTRLYRLAPEGPERVGGGEHFPEITTDSNHEASTAEAATLGKAIRWMKAEYPAERYAVVFYSHGSGNVWCPDETDEGHLFPAELTDELTEEDSLDLVVFDVCLMAGLENAYQWRPGTGRFAMDVMVATPMAGFPFPWQRIFGRLGPEDLDPGQLDALALGTLVVEESGVHREQNAGDTDLPPHIRAMIEREAMACVDLSRVEVLKERLDALGRALAKGEGRPALEAARGTIPLPVSLCYAPEGDWALPYFDVHDLATRIAEGAGENLALAEAARSVAEAADEAVVASYGLAAYDAQGGFTPGVHGLYVIVPDAEKHPTTGRSRFGALNWYSPEMVDAPGAYGSYVFCRDGATPGDGVIDNWFELMDAWYDEPGEGGLNGYTW